MPDGLVTVLAGPAGPVGALLARELEGRQGCVVHHDDTGFTITFDRPSDAARTAVELAERALGSPLVLHVTEGVSGAAPAAAARQLLVGADAGEIVLSVAAAELMADLLPAPAVLLRRDASDGRGSFVLGLPGPGRARTGPPPPVPRLLVSTGALVGRAKELDLLLEHLDATRGGGSRTLLIGGEPGIGKTRLVAEAAARASDDGVTVLYGRCDEGLGIPYQPMVEAIRDYLAAVGAPRLVREAGADLAELARIIPALREPLLKPPPPLVGDPDTERMALFEAMTRLVGTVAGDGGLMLVFDDLQWAARSTLLLLRHLTVAGVRGPALVVGTYRDNELGRGDPLVELLADVRHLPNTEVTNLTGLQKDDVAALVRAVAPEREATSLADHLFMATGGNPLFVTEMMRGLVTSGSLAAAPTAFPLPERVRDLVIHRVASLSPAAVRVLGAAAVLGLEFDLDAIEAMLGADCLDAVEEAERGGVLTATAGGFAFTHALVRQSVYDDLLAARRMRHHRRAAEVLAARGGVPAAILARHFAAGAADGAEDEAYSTAIEAARQAAESLAHEEGVTHIERALAALDRGGRPDARRVDLLLALVEHRAALLLDAPPAEGDPVLRAATEARATGDHEVLARTAYVLGLMTQPGQHRPEVAALLDDAIAHATTGPVGPAGRATEARLFIARASYQAQGASRPRQARADADAALALARDLGDVTLIRALETRAMAELGSPDVERRLALADESVSLIAAKDWSYGPEDWLRHSGRVASFGLRLRAAARLELGDVDGFSADTALLEEVGTRLHLRYEVVMANALRAAHLALVGRFDEATAARDRILTLGRFENPIVGATYRALFAHMEREAGRSAGLLPLLEVLVVQNPGLPAFRTALAAVAAETGAHETAAAQLGQLVADDLQVIPRDFTWTVSLAFMAEAAAHLGDPAAAEAIGRHLAPHSGHLVVLGWGVLSLGAVDRFLGMVAAAQGDLQEADGRFAAAAALEERLGARPGLTRTRLWWAKALRSTDPGRAKVLAEAAAAEAESLAMVGVAAEARQVEAAP
ncbi:MAG TPA: AAA family ATPase [Acidimicrobiales bacterium]|nr:AAA family ATPase [Acidimicrobiales bacterium]